MLPNEERHSDQAERSLIPYSDQWEEAEERTPDVALIVDVEGFEGPLDLLLLLARAHKLDLTKISILALAEQYLEFIDRVRLKRLEIAADYLVMAAWLAFLKSKLLLPKEEEDKPEASGEELAAQLAFRLQRLNAMREAAGKLMARKRLGHDIFGRGDPEPTILTRESEYSATLYDLLKAYTGRRQRNFVGQVKVPVRHVWSVKQARGRLERLLGMNLNWAPLHSYMPSLNSKTTANRTVLASAFGAILELAREGVVELDQSQIFGPLYLRKKTASKIEEADN